MFDFTAKDDTSLQSRSLMREERKEIQKKIKTWMRHNQRVTSVMCWVTRRWQNNMMSRWAWRSNSDEIRLTWR